MPIFENPQSFIQKWASDFPELVTSKARRGLVVCLLRTWFPDATEAAEVGSLSSPSTPLPYAQVPVWPCRGPAQRAD